jgi:gliding motility-associated-like protein
MRNQFLLVLLAIFFCTDTLAQDFSNKGKEFWIPYSYHVGMVNNNPSLTMTLYITSDVNANYTVEIFGVAQIQTGSIAAGQVVQVSVPNANFLNAAGKFTGKSVRVTSDKGVVVYSYITLSAQSGATVCLPTNVLGREYYSMNYTQVSNENNSNSYFTVIAVEDNTTVEIIPSAPTTEGWLANSVNTVTLNKGEIYQVLGTVVNTAGGGLKTGVDLTGSKIRSVASGNSGCKRIAVFSGAGKMKIGASCGSNTSSDNLYQQLYPVASWGKSFLTVPSFSRPTNYYRIIKNADNTNVYVNGALVPPASFVNGRFYEWVSTTPNIITSDQPIAVTQYFTTQGCDGNPAPYDPDMIVLNPVEQNISKVTLVSSNLAATQGREHHIHLIIPNGGTAISSFRLDNQTIPASSWTVHPGNSAYSYAYLNNVSQGYHTLSSDSGFNALAYGYANAESYGYSAGANIKDLYQYVTLQNSNASVRFPTTCQNTPFLFSMTFPYKPIKISWFFGTALNGFGLADEVISNPVPDDSTLVSGKMLYSYKLPKQYMIPSIGIYPVRLLANNPTADGCSGEQEINYDVEVIAPPIARFNFTSVCKGQPMQFSDTSSTSGRQIASVKWNFTATDSSTNFRPSFMFSDSGNYTVRYSLISDVGCNSDIGEQIVRVTPLPSATISGAGSFCLNADAPQITFRGGLGTAPYTFTYDINGGPSQTVSSTTGNTAMVTAPTGTVGLFSYNLVAVREGGPTACAQNQSGTAGIRILPTPKAAISGTVSVCEKSASPSITFTGSDGDAPYTVTYTLNGGPVQTVTTSGNLANVSVPTAVPGTYTYSLVSVSDNNGTLCQQNQAGSAVVTVNPLPTATIGGSTSVCLNAPPPLITFTGTVGQEPFTFQYNVNGGAVQTVTTTSGNSVTVQAPTGAAGTFVYSLVSVTDGSTTACAKAQTGSATVVVWTLPVADYTTNNPVCAIGLIDFTDLSTPGFGTVAAWQWDFDDPRSGAQNTSAIKQPSHVFYAPGTYNVKLTATTSNGCISINTVRSLVVNPRPKAGFIIPEVCLNDTYAQFLDSSKVTLGGTIQSWLWNFGDRNATIPPVSSNTSTQKDPQHSFKDVGNYQVNLIVTSNQGCNDTITQTLAVNGSFPVAKFSVVKPTTLCVNDSVSITDASTVFPGSITKIEIWWDNAGSPSLVYLDDYPTSGKVYRHLYPNFQSPLTRTYQIRYRVYSGGVCTSETTQTITVNAAPRIRFDDLPQICMEAPPYQIIEAAETGGVPGAWLYSGSGVSPTGLLDPAKAGFGSHRIRYTYTSTAGCTEFLEKVVTVNPSPVVDAGPNLTVLDGAFVKIQAKSSGTATGLTYQWTPALGLDDPAKLAPLAGPPNDTRYFLRAVSDKGCVGTSSVFVKVLLKPVVPNTFTPNGDGYNDKWDIKDLNQYVGCVVEVYNTAGALIFRSTGYGQPWDGTSNGKPVPAGTYYYVIDPKNGRSRIAGYVTVLR